MRPTWRFGRVSVRLGAVPGERGLGGPAVEPLVRGLSQAGLWASRGALVVGVVTFIGLREGLERRQTWWSCDLLKADSARLNQKLRDLTFHI